MPIKAFAYLVKYKFRSYRIRKIGLTFSFVPAVFDVASIAIVFAVVVTIGPVVVAILRIVVSFGLVVLVLVVVVGLARIFFCDRSHVHFDVFSQVDVCCSARIIGYPGHSAVEEDVWHEMFMVNSPELCGIRGLIPRTDSTLLLGTGPGYR